MKISEFMVNFLLSTSFAASFITLFFFTYAKNVEREIVVNNVNYTINDLLSGVFKLMPNNIKKIILNKIDTINFNNMKSADEETNAANNNLMYFCIKLYGTLLIVSFALAFIIAKYNHINFEDILVSNLNLLVAIGTTEYLFLNQVIAKFISADPNQVKYAIIKNL